MLNDGIYEEEIPRLKVSVIERIVPALSYTIAAIGGGLSGYMLLRMMQALRKSESAGISTVMAGMAEANIPVLVALYLAVFVGLIGVIISIAFQFATRKTSSSPIWLPAIPAIFGLLPVLMVWYAETLIIDVISPSSRTSGQGAAEVGSTVATLIIVAIIFAFVSIFVSLAMSVLPFSSQASRRLGPVALTVSFEVVLIVLAVLFQVRTWSLYQQVMDR
jgi:hypothetical protein